MVTDTSPGPGRLTIILHSGAYDRVCYSLWTSIAALASGMEAHILLTFEGLRRFTKANINNIGEETPATVQEDIKFGLEAGVVQTIEEQLAEAKKMGLKVYACPNAMASCKIPMRELVGVDQVMGLVGFLGLARTANVNLYI